MARATRVLIPILLFATVSLLVGALVGSQASSQLPIFTTLLPFLILAAMIWYLITIILERKTIIELIRVWIEIILRQRGQGGGRRFSLFAYLASFLLVMIVISAMSRLRSVRSIIEQVADSVAVAGQGVTNQLVGSSSDVAPAAGALYAHVLAYSSAIVFAGIIVVSVGLVIVGITGGLKQIREHNLHDFELTKTQTVETIRDTSRKLEAGGDYYELILACYKKMCDLLSAHGAPTYDSQTPREFERVAGKVLAVSEQALDRLTRLFEEARYSTHVIDQAQRLEAIECLREIEDELSKEIPNVSV